MSEHEFSSKAGTIYLEKVKAGDREFEVWFEDFCILGTGNSEAEALRQAERHTADIGELIRQALSEF